MFLPALVDLVADNEDWEGVCLYRHLDVTDRSRPLFGSAGNQKPVVYAAGICDDHRGVAGG